MTTHNLLLYVADPAVSARFYSGLLGLKPLEESPTFVLFGLASGVALSLWRRDGVEPAPTAAGGGAELGIKCATPGDVDACFTEWAAKGAPILMAPADKEFGRTFVAADPDGHRIRVYSLSEPDDM